MHCDLAVIGGGMAGTCCAITAARAGIKVVLIQDRPVLGGNASSEVRLWVLGATSHMYNNNRWAREGGVLNEILVENMWRNPEGNALLFDTVLLEKVLEEPNITLLLNTGVLDCSKAGPDTIASVRAFCSQNSTMYDVHAPLFCDASGDGILGFMAGAAFRMGAESRDEFGEKFAPPEEFGELLGHSIYFYSKDTGRPVHFEPPSYALRNISQKIPRYRNFNTREDGCRLWWIEYGGRLDTVHETEAIKWELWKVVYGVWDYIKNSGEFPEAENLTLEWVGHIPGKRESRRFEGDYMLTQQDFVEQRHFDDAVAFGGWALDLHPADGVFSPLAGCTHWHSKGTYSIPYRCLFSRNIDNLFLAGRIISSSHVAFGSTRVMATLAHAAQATGMAAALCHRDSLKPAALAQQPHLTRLQQELMCSGQHIRGFHLHDSHDLAQTAQITASSELRLAKLPASEHRVQLTHSWAQLLPLTSGAAPVVTFFVDVAASTEFELQLRASSKPDNFTPDVVLGTQTIHLEAGDNQRVSTAFDVDIVEPCYVFYCLIQNEDVRVHGSEQRVTGLLSVQQNYTQRPPHDIGVDEFELWCPQRRPGGYNLAMEIEPLLQAFAPQSIRNGVQRPTTQVNAWVASVDDKRPTLRLNWNESQTISRLELSFDTDFDHPMESVLMGHPERAVPFCVRHYRVLNGTKVLWEQTDNHQTRNTIRFNTPVQTSELTIEVLASHGDVPAALFEVRCYENA
jgi:hypothetical protein